MLTLLAQIAPQRSTQYAALADALAAHELTLCPLGAHITAMTPVRQGGQNYLKCALSLTRLSHAHRRELGQLAMTSAFFIYYEKLGRIAGPLLRPIETEFEPPFAADLTMTRRYRGKTNELFTHFMCNIARFSSALSHRPWRTLRVFDPLSGGGTTLFTAMVLGADVAGVERSAQDVKSTVAFLKQYLRGRKYEVKKERLKKIGARWSFTIDAPQSAKRCILACGDTVESAALISGFRPHLIVADLPYGIQHQGQLPTLLAQALPVWASLLPPSGAMTLAWESKRFPRREMIALVESAGPLRVLNHPPYDALAHRVDRVIKQRDVLVARPAEAVEREMANVP